MLMASLYRTYADPLTDQMLFDWHGMLMNGRRDLADIGRYRTHVDPMQIVSGDLHAPRVHYAAPPSDTVSTEIQAFFEWFNDRAPQGTNALQRPEDRRAEKQMISQDSV